MSFSSGVKSTVALLSQITKSIKKKVNDAAERVAEAVAESQLESLTERMSQGLGLDDAPMPPLSFIYAKKQKKGLRRNLVLSGQMKNSLRVKQIKRSWHMIEFSNSKAQKKGKYNQDRYSWFGVSPKDRKKALAAGARALLKGKKK